MCAETNSEFSIMHIDKKSCETNNQKRGRKHFLGEPRTLQMHETKNIATTQTHWHTTLHTKACK